MVDRGSSSGLRTRGASFIKDYQAPWAFKTNIITNASPEEKKEKNAERNNKGNEKYTSNKINLCGRKETSLPSLPTVPSLDQMVKWSN